MIIKWFAKLDKRVVIVSDDTVSALYATNFYQALKKIKRDTLLLNIKPSEESKSRKVKHYLEDQLIKNGVDRDTILVAFGGGVVTDITGYLSATYLRGVAIALIPTTLLAMVDAAIGGKNGINHLKGKNLFGTIKEADLLIIEPNFLKTLPKDVYKEGFIEVVKYGLIYDDLFFSDLEMGRVDEKSFIDRSIQIKRSIVKKDLRENGLRRILNFGHLVAHAIEKCSSYKVTHGKSVWFGILVEVYLSYLLGFLPYESVTRIAMFLLKEELFFSSFFRFDPYLIYETMRMDKKSLKGMPRCVLLKRIGKCVSFGGEYCTEISYAHFLEAFLWGCNLIENPFAIRSLTS